MDAQPQVIKDDVHPSDKMDDNHAEDVIVSSTEMVMQSGESSELAGGAEMESMHSVATEETLDPLKSAAAKDITTPT